MKKQIRSYEVKTDEKPLVLEGMAIVFDRPAKIGEITEYISRDALEGLDLSSVALLVNHDGTGIPLARSPKTLALTVTEKGLAMRAELPHTETAKAVYEAVKRGDLSQMSFAFDVGAYIFDEETQTRTITQISKVYEISVVNFAAYQETNVQARAGKEGVYNSLCKSQIR